MMKTSDLRAKEVVNTIDGKRLGHIIDIEINVETGKLTAIVVPGNGRFFGFFGRNEEIVIPWDKINKIGLDVILVETTASVDYERLERYT